MEWEVVEAESVMKPERGGGGEALRPTPVLFEGGEGAGMHAVHSFK